MDVGRLLMFISSRNYSIVCVFMGLFQSFAGLFVGILCICMFWFASLQLSSPRAVALQFRFQASFISYTGVTAFLIFQTNGHVSIAACQFWFYDSFIIKRVRLQCSATDGLLHFSHGQAVSLLYVCVCGRRGRPGARTCVCMFVFRHGWLSSLS